MQLTRSCDSPITSRRFSLRASCKRSMSAWSRENLTLLRLSIVRGDAAGGSMAVHTTTGTHDNEFPPPLFPLVPLWNTSRACLDRRRAPASRVLRSERRRRDTYTRRRNTTTTTGRGSGPRVAAIKGCCGGEHGGSRTGEGEKHLRDARLGDLRADVRGVHGWDGGLFQGIYMLCRQKGGGGRQNKYPNK